MTAAVSSRPATPSFVYVVTAFAAVGGLLFGYDTGVISGALPFLKREFSLTTFAEALAASGGWRWMFGLAVLPGLLQLVGMSLLPDSPRWLVSKGRIDEARSVLRRFSEGADAERELTSIRGALAVETGGTFSELASPALRPALVVGVAMAVFQQITGINTVIYYAPEIFAQAGFEGARSELWASLVVASVNVLATLIAVRWLDRVGRRPLLVAGLVGMGASLALLGALFASSASGDLVAPASVALLAAYVACFAFSLGPIVWVLISEIYPLRVRGLAVSVATMANWGANLVVGLSFLTLIDRLGKAGTFWLFAALTAANLVFVLRRVPETKGRTLEAIEAQWTA